APVRNRALALDAASDGRGQHLARGHPHAALRLDRPRPDPLRPPCVSAAGASASVCARGAVTKGVPMRDPDFTLSAGPVMASPRVLAALGSPITYHYDPAFLEAFRRTERKLAEIFLTKNDVLLMQGEAVLGLEAAARSLVRPGMPVLNLVQGVFGKGMGHWLKD